MNCHFCQQPCSKTTPLNDRLTECWVCHQHSHFVFHFLDPSDEIDLIEIYSLNESTPEYCLRISYEIKNKELQIHKVYGQYNDLSWGKPYSTLWKSHQPSLNISPENIEEKLKTILTFL